MEKITKEEHIRLRRLHAALHDEVLKNSGLAILNSSDLEWLLKKVVEE